MHEMIMSCNKHGWLYGRLSRLQVEFMDTLAFEQGVDGWIGTRHFKGGYREG